MVANPRAYRQRGQRGQRGRKGRSGKGRGKGRGKGPALPGDAVVTAVFFTFSVTDADIAGVTVACSRECARLGCVVFERSGGAA